MSSPLESTSETLNEHDGEHPTVVEPQFWLDEWLHLVTRQAASQLAKVPWMTPNLISLSSAMIGGAIAGYCIYQGQFYWACGMTALSGVLDSLDGDLARVKNMASVEGAILDSVLDRYVDFCLVGALVLVTPDGIIAGLLAIFGSVMVPFVRARTEASGKSTVASIGNRSIRVIAILIGLLTHQILPLLIFLAAVTNIAAIHRFIIALRPES